MSSILDQLQALKLAEKQKIEARRARMKIGASTTSTRRPFSASLSSAASAPSPAEHTDSSDMSSLASGRSNATGESHRSKSDVATVSTAEPGFRQSMAVDRIWQEIKKKVPDYEAQVGEEIIMQMIELEPKSRKEMGIGTLRSERFVEAAKILVGIVEIVVSLVGPDMVEQSEEEFLRIGRQCEYEGIRVQLLGTSISNAVRLIKCDKLKESEVEAWKVVFDHVSWKMLPATSSAFETI